VETILKKQLKDKSIVALIVAKDTGMKKTGTIIKDITTLIEIN
jgi:hypothetical protein